MCNDLLIERGSNEGVAGEDVYVQFAYPLLRVNIRDTKNNETNSIPIATIGGVTKTTWCEVIIITNQCAYYSKWSSIHCSRQVEHFKNFIKDKSIEVGGK